MHTFIQFYVFQPKWEDIILQSVIVFSAGSVSDIDSKNMYFCLFVVRQGQELRLLPQLLSFHDMQCIIIIDILTKFEI